MLLAHAPDGTTRQPATSGEPGHCPHCQGTLLGKHGNIVVHHWAHLPDHDCDPWTAPESSWHLEWKQRALARGWPIEQTITRDGIRHRSDITTPSGATLELQHGYLPVEDITAREAFYPNLVWLYDARSWWNDNRLHTGKELANGYWGFWFKTGGKSLATHRCPIYFDIGTHIWEVNLNLVYNSHQEVERLIGQVRTVCTNRQFIRYFRRDGIYGIDTAGNLTYPHQHPPPPHVMAYGTARWDSKGIHLEHPRQFSPDGVPWCHFGTGLDCRNGDDCLNLNHRDPGE